MNREKVINARVSQKIYEAIAKKAQKNRVSVSNLIRNLVEDAIELHEEFHDTVDEIILGKSEKVDPSEIIGFQEIQLTKATNCAICNQLIASNSKAHLAIMAHQQTNIIVCTVCKDK